MFYNNLINVRYFEYNQYYLETNPKLYDLAISKTKAQQGDIGVSTRAERYHVILIQLFYLIYKS